MASKDLDLVSKQLHGIVSVLLLNLVLLHQVPLHQVSLLAMVRNVFSADSHLLALLMKFALMPQVLIMASKDSNLVSK